MILDWAKQCEKIHSTKELSRDDPSDNKRHYMQEVVYLCYLKNVLGKNEVECYKEWKKIKNGIASIFADDEEQLLIEFVSMYRRAENKKYTGINYVTPLEPVPIYNTEINFLNSADVPIWVKQYWLCLLVFYKFMRQKYQRIQKTKLLNAWAIRQTDYKKKNYGGNCQDTIAQYNKSLESPAILDFTRTSTEHFPTYVPNFIRNKGKVAYLCSDINNIKEAFNLLTSNYKICDICGQKFIVNSKTKRTICEDCYKKYRKKRILDFVDQKDQKNIKNG